MELVDGLEAPSKNSKYDGLHESQGTRRYCLGFQRRNHFTIASRYQLI